MGDAGSAVKEREEEIAVLTERNRMLEMEREGLTKCLLDNYKKIDSVVPALLPPSWVTENGLSAAQAVESLENLLVRERKLRHDAENRTRALEHRIRQMERSHLALLERYTNASLSAHPPAPDMSTAATQVEAGDIAPPVESDADGEVDGSFSAGADGPIGGGITARILESTTASLCSKCSDQPTDNGDNGASVGSPFLQASLLSTREDSETPRVCARPRSVGLQTEPLSRRMCGTNDYFDALPSTPATSEQEPCTPMKAVGLSDAAAQTDGIAAPTAAVVTTRDAGCSTPPMNDALSAVSSIRSIRSASMRTASSTPLTLALDRSASVGHARLSGASPLRPHAVRLSTTQRKATWR